MSDPIYSDPYQRIGHWKERAEVAEARVRELEEALKEARPYVFGRLTEEGWRGETARDVLARVDAALVPAKEERA